MEGIFGKMKFIEKFLKIFEYPKYRIVRFEVRYAVQVKQNRYRKWEYLDTRMSGDCSWNDLDYVRKYCLFNHLHQAEEFVESIKFEVVKTY